MARTLAEAVDEGARRLERAAVPMPRREAEWLMAELIGTDRGGVFARRLELLPAGAAERYEAWIRRREAREPFQYLLGETEFMGRLFRVDRRVLIPRPETEQLVDTVLALALPDGARVADLGTGSGCIAVSLALERPDLRILAFDRSADALALAEENARRLEARAEIRFLRGDWTDLDAGAVGELDVVVSNPPYVGADEWKSLAPEVRDFEPREALVPGPTGDEAYEVLAPLAPKLLRPDGFLVVELGYRSLPGALEACRRAGLNRLRVENDPRGIPRILVARVGSQGAGWML